MPRLKTSRRGREQGAAKRQRHRVPAADQLQNVTESPSTPPHGSSVVDVEEVSANFTQLTVAARAESPKSRKKGTLPKRRLFGQEQRSALLPPWSTLELRALVTYLLSNTDGRTWPSRRADEAFWNEAGKFIQSVVSSTYYRTGIYVTMWSVYYEYECDCEYGLFGK